MSCSVDGKCPNFSLWALFKNARRNDVSKFWAKNKAILTF